MLVDSDRLMGTAEVRQRLNVGDTRLRELMRRDTFPRPLIKLSSGYVWAGEHIDAWITEYRPDLNEDPPALAEDPEGE